MTGSPGPTIKFVVELSVCSEAILRAFVAEGVFLLWEGRQKFFFVLLGFDQVTKPKPFVQAHTCAKPTIRPMTFARAERGIKNYCDPGRHDIMMATRS